MTDQRRWQFEVPDQQALQLKSLMQDCGITTQKDLLNSALTLFQWTVKEIKRGRIIASADVQRMQLTEFSMPPFEVLRRSQISYAQRAMAGESESEPSLGDLRGEFIPPHAHYQAVPQRQYQAAARAAGSGGYGGDYGGGYGGDYGGDYGGGYGGDYVPQYEPPGSHPVGTGVGAAGGAVAGAAIGAVAGPIGAYSPRYDQAAAGAAAGAAGSGGYVPQYEPPGSHPVGTGVGAAGGAVAGAAIGAVAGPIGAAAGAVVGAIAGGLAGHAAGEAVNPTISGEPEQQHEVGTGPEIGPHTLGHASSKSTTAKRLAGNVRKK